MSDDFGDVGDFEEPALLTPEIIEKLSILVADLIESAMIEISDVIHDWRENNDSPEDIQTINQMKKIIGRMDQGEGSRYEALIKVVANSPSIQNLMAIKANESMSAIFYSSEEEDDVEFSDDDDE
jgi:hypothetical protein